VWRPSLAAEVDVPAFAIAVGVPARVGGVRPAWPEACGGRSRISAGVHPRQLDHRPLVGGTAPGQQLRINAREPCGGHEPRILAHVRW
jgi:hypothetical protein